jgi:hypothetical protein
MADLAQIAPMTEDEYLGETKALVGAPASRVGERVHLVAEALAGRRRSR